MNRRHMEDSAEISGPDGILHGILPGDSIIWQNDSAEDLALCVMPCAQYTVNNGRSLPEGKKLYLSADAVKQLSSLYMAGGR